MIQRSVPKTIIHQGAIDGIDKARSHAVTRPLPSKINGFIGSFLIARIALSVRTTVRDARVIFTITPSPNA
jgi:hypothetical protein